MSGILVHNTIGSHPKWIVTNAIEHKWMILVGDGLSCEHVRQFRSQIWSMHTCTQDDVFKYYEHSSHIMKEMDHVVVVSGDLHAGLFP